MKKLIFLLVAVILLANTSFSQVYVRGYVKKNGTYVAPYVRSSPDHNAYNNYSYPGNTNPYTGKVATGNPDTYLNNYYEKAKKTAVAFLTKREIYLTPVSTKYYSRTNDGTPVYYIIKSSFSPEYCQYKMYNMKDVYIGYLNIYTTGQLYIFDINSKPVANLPM